MRRQLLARNDPSCRRGKTAALVPRELLARVMWKESKFEERAGEGTKKTVQGIAGISCAPVLRASPPDTYYGQWLLRFPCNARREEAVQCPSRLFTARLIHRSRAPRRPPWALAPLAMLESTSGFSKPLPRIGLGMARAYVAPAMTSLALPLDFRRASFRRLR